MDELMSLMKSFPLACLAFLGVMGMAWAIHEIRNRRGK